MSRVWCVRAPNLFALASSCITSVSEKPRYLLIRYVLPSLFLRSGMEYRKRCPIHHYRQELLFYSYVYSLLLLYLSWRGCFYFCVSFVLCRVIQQSCTQAHTLFVSLQDIVIPAPLQPSQKAWSCVSSAKVTGLKPSREFIFITAAPVVMLKILACGYKVRDSLKIFFLIRIAIPRCL